MQDHTQIRVASSLVSGGSFCLFFARGGCAHGEKCGFYHRVPVGDDLGRLAQDELRDCFGREVNRRVIQYHGSRRVIPR